MSDAPTCPLGDDCDLTAAYMAGHERGKDAPRNRIAALEDEITRLRAKVERLKDALRLIELFGYREGEELGWVNAHMTGIATAAQEGNDLAFYWRLFPNHRPLAQHKDTKGETP